MMQITVEGDAAENIRKKAGAELERARSNLIREAAVETLQRIVVLNPVDTARSRAAWVSMLEDLGGTPPSGWEGPHPSAVEQGRPLGQAVLNEATSLSEARLTNSVDYVSYLEYGTSRMSPFAMVRSALGQVAGILGELFHWGGREQE